MSLLQPIDLDNDQIDAITSVVHCWCQDHSISLDSDEGRMALSVVVDRLSIGETSPVALSEAINVALAARGLLLPTPAGA